MINKLVFSVTHDCPISCKYCVTRSGPKNGPYLDAGFMKSTITAVTELTPLISVIFTGGEPLLKMDEVEETIRFAHTHGLWTRVVTNAFWAKTPESAAQYLGRLVQAGLSEINFSCDDLHQEHIPLQNIHHAFWAAKKAGLPALIAHKKVASGKITPESLSAFLGVELKEFKEYEKCQEGPDLYSTSLTVPVGHGTETLDEKDFIIYPENPYVWSYPCNGVLNGLIISPDRQISLCCGMMEQTVPELHLGAWDNSRVAELIEECNSDLIANWLALEGPYGMMKVIREKDPSITFRNHYVNHCHLCNEILTRPDTRAVLMQCAGEKAGELSLRRGLLEALRYVDPEKDAARNLQEIPAA
jgi:hypothetical protein